MKYLFAFLIFFIDLEILQAQDLKIFEDTLKYYEAKLGSPAVSDQEKIVLGEEMDKLSNHYLTNPEAFSYPFSDVKKISTITASDDRIRLFNWNVSLTDGTHRYYCYLLFKKGNRDHKLFRLNDSGSLNHDIVHVEIEPENWYGAIYYDIQPVKYRGREYYVLLGWDGNDHLSTKKVIEILYVQGNRIKLGAPLLEEAGKIKHREVFEYAENVSMTLKFVPEENYFVFDKLAPIRGHLEGEYKFYGPSLSFDAYRFSKNGKLELQQNVPFLRPKDEENGRFSTPAPPDMKKKREKKNPLTGKPNPQD